MRNLKKYKNRKEEKFRVGDKVEVFWTGENKWFPGRIKYYHNKTDRFVIQYDDGDYSLSKRAKIKKITQSFEKGKNVTEV